MANQGQARLSRDQLRAVKAYQAVQPATAKGQEDQEQLDKAFAKIFKDYKILVNDLGAHVRRSGLSATLAFVERNKKDAAARHLLGVLASAELPGLEGATAEDLARRIRELAPAQYMLVTREVLKLAIWLRRAVQSRDAQELDQHGGEHAASN